MPEKPVRVRFAPSPTGYLHIGGARTALFNWLFARHHGGKFILRIEDTDRKRYVPDALEDITSGLRWLGLDWDEGPEVGGPYGPYFQSERTELYRKWAHWLVEHGHAYKCFCTPERLERMRKEQAARGEPPRYDRKCRFLTPEEVEANEKAGKPYVIRFKSPLTGHTTFTDLIRGEITFDHKNLDDFILLKSDGFPTYHLANVIDDHFMEISHIMRGDEWISSAPKHILLYQAFGWEPPKLAHLPLILDPSGKGKLSKRKKRVAGQELLVFVKEFREAGYLPEALFNFLANIGWSFDGSTEIFTREEAIARFDIRDINPAPAAMPYTKLDWINGVYIRKLSADELKERLIPFLSRDMGIPEEELRKRKELDVLVPIIQERIKRLDEAAGLIDFAFKDEIEYPPEMLIQKKMTPESTLKVLDRTIEALEEVPDFDSEALEQRLRALVDELGMKAREVFGVIRVATTGKKVAPPLFGSLEALGRERTLERLRKARELILPLCQSSENE